MRVREDMSAMQTYLGNVKNAVHRNLIHYMKHDQRKEEFLDKVIEYCEKIKNDPSEPKIKRRRIRKKRGYYTRKGGDQ